jgi:hypothetical protein
MTTNYKSLLISTLIYLGLASCATSVNSVSSVKVFTIPEINAYSTVELGETVLSKGKIMYKKGAELSEAITFRLLDAKVNVKPTKLELTNETKTLLGFKTTNFDDLEFSDILHKKNNNYGIIYANKSDLSVKSVAVFMVNDRPSNKIPAKLEKPVFLKEIELVDHAKADNFQQEFIYSGKAGNVLKFTYREFTNDMARPAFNQDVQYDLTESNEIGFKGARLLVLNATNTKLEYRLITAFK